MRVHQRRMPVEVAPAVVTSLPAMAAAMRTLKCTNSAQPLHDLFAYQQLVPMYAVRGDSAQEEAAAAVSALEDVSDRLRRLRAAYGEWNRFDAEAYFDLTIAQCQRLVRVSERVSTVHVTFYADLMLPSFIDVEAYWFDHYCPAYLRMLDGFKSEAEPADLVDAFIREVQPQMVQRWQTLNNVIRMALDEIHRSNAHLLAYLCQDELTRWRSLWQRPAARGVADSLQPDFQSLPTLTLSTEFPLPMNRQPGRLRRLRANRMRGRPRHFLHWRALDG